MDSKHVGVLLKDGCDTARWCGLTVDCIEQEFFDTEENRCQKNRLVKLLLCCLQFLSLLFHV